MPLLDSVMTDEPVTNIGDLVTRHQAASHEVKDLSKQVSEYVTVSVT